MSANTKRLPDFIGIGAMRCGTTWISDQLRSHPDIHIPPHYKEVHFFDRYYDKGMDWYLSNFSGRADHQIAGEFTPYYVRDAVAMTRLSQDCPDAKLILAIRNPVERAWSHYKFLKNRKSVSSSFFETLHDERFEILEAGRYGAQLQRCLELFPKDQICIISFDEIKASPERTISKLYSFLEVDTDYKPEAPRTKSNAGHAVRSMFLARILRLAKQLVRPFTSGRRGIMRLGFFKFGKMINRLNATAVDQVEMDEDVLAFLNEYYLEDLTLLAELVGKEVKLWELHK